MEYNPECARICRLYRCVFRRQLCDWSTRFSDELSRHALLRSVERALCVKENRQPLETRPAVEKYA